MSVINGTQRQFGCCSDAEFDLYRDGAYCSHDHQVSPQQGEGATRRPLLPPPTGDVPFIIVDYRAPPVCPPAEAPSATLPRSLPPIGKTLHHQHLITPAPFIALPSHRKRRQEGCHCRTVHTVFKKRTTCLSQKSMEPSHVVKARPRPKLH